MIITKITNNGPSVWEPHVSSRSLLFKLILEINNTQGTFKLPMNI